MANGESTVYRIGADSSAVLEAMRQIGTISEQTFQRMQRASEPANRAVEKLDQNVAGLKDQMRSAANSIAVLDGPLGGIASRINAFATAIGRVGIAGAGMAVAVTGITFGLTQAVRAQSAYEQSQLRLEQVLKATGNAAGFTARQIDDMSRELGIATLTSATDARDAAQVLLTFRSIQGTTFRDTLSTAQDLSAVFGQSLRQSAVMLGKAMEDPIRGLTALRRVGVSFTSSEQELIRTLAESGKMLEAQGLIMAGLERQVGGAGEAEAGGVAGAVDTLGEQFRALLEDIGAATRAAEVWKDTMAGTAEIIKEFREEAFPQEPADRIAAAQERVRELEQRLEEAGPQTQGDPLFIAPNIGEQLLTARRQLAEEVRKLETEIAMQYEAALSAEGYRIDAQIERENERKRSIQSVLDEIQAEIDLVGKSSEMKELAAARAKEMAEANEEEAASYLVLKRNLEEANAAEDRRLARQQLLKELRVERESIFLSEGATRLAEQLGGDFRDAPAHEKNQLIDLITTIEELTAAREAEEEAKKRSEANDTLIQSLEQEIALRTAATEAQKRAIETLAKLSDDASPEQLAQVERLLARLERLDRRDEAEEAAEERRKGVERAQDFIESLRLENAALTQTEAQARKAAAAINELSGALPEQAAIANALIDNNVRAAEQAERDEEAQDARRKALEVVRDLEREIQALRQSPAETSLANYLDRAGLGETGEIPDQIRALNDELMRTQRIIDTAPIPRDRGLALDEIALRTNEETTQAMRDQATAMNDLINTMRPGAAAAAEFRSEVALLNSTIGQDMLREANITHAEAMQSLRMQYIDTSSLMVQTMRQATSSISGLFADMVRGVRVSLDQMATDLAAFVVQSGIQRLLNFGVDYGLAYYGAGSTIATGPDVATSSSTGGTFAQVRHSGGLVDNSGPTRLVPSSLFLTAPRYHNGLGLGADEMPAILQRGERVIPKGQSVSGPQEIKIRVVGDPSGESEVTEINEPGAGRSFQLMMRNATLQTLGGREARMMMAQMYGLRARSR